MAPATKRNIAELTTNTNVKSKASSPTGKKKSKQMALSYLDLSTKAKITASYYTFKGKNADLPPSLLDILKEVVDIYNMNELKDFTKDKLCRDWPKGNKSVGVHFMATQLMKEVQFLSVVNTGIDDKTCIEEEPKNNYQPVVSQTNLKTHGQPAAKPFTNFE